MKVGTRSAWIVLCFAVAFGGGCTTPPVRLDRSRTELLRERATKDAELQAETRRHTQVLLARVKREYDRAMAAHEPPPTVNILIISGGGDWGAFAAGVLKGWGQIKGNSGLPTFDMITGVSAGALLAPYMFVEAPRAIDRAEGLFRNPRPDWFEHHGLFWFLPSRPSLDNVAGLERDLRTSLDDALIDRVAGEGQDGRVLEVSASDLDDGTMHVWDMVAEARRAQETRDYERFRRILLASAAVPAVFPPRLVDGTLYVDGAVTSNILYGGEVHEDQSFPAVWQQTYPDLPIPAVRYWVIFNNQLRAEPAVIQPRWTDIILRSTETASRSATVTALRHLAAKAEISRLKRHANIEVRVMAVPNDWLPPKPGLFVKETMNALADLGQRMGADPASWRTIQP